MNEERLRQMIVESAREEIVRGVENKESENISNVNESVMLGLASIASLGAGWAWMRNFSRRMMGEKHLRTFIEIYDTDKVIERQLPETLRRFNLVNSLTDLDSIESRFESLMGQLNALVGRVDEYIDTVSDESVSSRFLAIKPAQQKKELTRTIKEFITKTKTTFSAEMNAKRDSILG